MILSSLVLTSCGPENADIPKKKVKAVELNITITPFIEFDRNIEHRERVMQYLLERHFKKSGIAAVCDKNDILLRYSTGTPAKDVMLLLAYTSFFESLVKKMENDRVALPEDKLNPTSAISPLNGEFIDFVMEAYTKQNSAKNSEEIARQFPLIQKGDISKYADDKTTYFSSLAMSLKVHKKDKLIAIDFNFSPEGYFCDYGVNFQQATGTIIDTEYIESLRQDMSTDEKRAYYLTAVYESAQIQTIRKRVAVKNTKNINYLTDPIVVPTTPTESAPSEISEIQAVPDEPATAEKAVETTAPSTRPASTRTSSHSPLSAPF